MSESLAAESAASDAATASPERELVAPPSFARTLLGGAIAAAIALACFLPPLVHFVTGPLGPLIGGFVVAQRLKPDASGCAVMAGTIGLTFALLGAAGAGAISAFAGPSGPPEWFPDTASLALILGGVAAYAAVVGGVGALLGGRRASAEAGR